VGAIVEWLPDEPGRLGAGPGEIRTYFVDIPVMKVLGVEVYGGPNQAITLPTQALVGDALAYARYWVPTLVDDAMTRARQYAPVVGRDLVDSAWPILQTKLEEELPRLVLEVQPEVQKIQRRFEWALGIFAVGIVGFVWWRTR